MKGTNQQLRHIAERYPEVHHAYSAAFADHGFYEQLNSQIALGATFGKIFYNWLNPNRTARNLRQNKGVKEIINAGNESKTIYYTDFQRIVDERKGNSSRGFADVGDFEGWKMIGDPLHLPTEDDDSLNLGELDPRQQIEFFFGLNFSNTNALEILSPNNSYFSNSDFSGVRFPSGSQVFFDECVLSGADFSNTIQKNLYLGGTASFFIELRAMDLDAYLRYNPNKRGTPEYQHALQEMEVLRKAAQSLVGTKADHVNFGGTTFDRHFSDNYLVDYEGSNFVGATLNSYSSFFSGKNLQMRGLQIATEDGDFITISNPITREEIAEKQGQYVARLLGNNVVSANDKTPAIIAISGSRLDPQAQQAIEKCNEIFKQQVRYQPIDSQTAQEIADMFNRLINPDPSNPKYNVRYIVDDGVTPYDFSSVYCNATDLSAQGSTANLGMNGKRLYTAIQGGKFDAPLFLHEGMHQLGAQHPQEVGIFPTRSTSLASNVAYNNGKNLLVKIANESNPLFLNPIEGYGVQDHKILEVVFGLNSNHQSNDTEFNLEEVGNRMYFGNKGHSNKLIIDRRKLPKGTNVLVYKASGAVGTCYGFPCDPRDLAAGLEDAVLVVLYGLDKNNQLTILGNSLVFGGANNTVVVDGKEITPINPFEFLATEQLQAIINQRKLAANGTEVDLSDISKFPIKGKIVDLGYNKYSTNKIEVFEDLDVSGTNFAQVFSLDNKYFRNCNFSGCRFGNATKLILDGCNLGGADMSNTTQTDLMLGADTLFISRSIAAIGTNLHHLKGVDYDDGLTSLKLLEDRLASVRPTNFSQVNLQGATLKNPSDNYLTNYEGTRFEGVKISYREKVNPKVYATLMGENLDLKGALYDLGNEKYFEINKALSAEKVGEATNEYVKAMLRNNILNQRSDRPTLIAIASGVGSQESYYNNNCTNIYDTDTAFAPVNVDELQKVVDFYNRQDDAYNVKYVAYKPDQQHDFVLSICRMLNIGEGGQEGSYSLLKRDMSIAIGGETINDPVTLLHEKNHDQGSIHPFDGSIPAQKCSPFASVMCYENALDIMIPLGNSSRPITLQQPIDYGVQDHLANLMIFGFDPNYLASDRNTTLSFNQSRIIRGDENFNNIGSFNSSDLPEDYNYAVLDAAKALGTCYQFPCDSNNLASGVAGTLVVFFPKDQSSGKSAYGTLLYGGKTNAVVVNGKEINTASPTNQPTKSPTDSPTTSPTNQPTKSPTDSPTNSMTSGSKNNKNSELGPDLVAIVSAFAGSLIIATCVVRHIMNSKPSTEVTNMECVKKLADQNMTLEERMWHNFS